MNMNDLYVEYWYTINMNDKYVHGTMKPLLETFYEKRHVFHTFNVNLQKGIGKKHRTKLKLQREHEFHGHARTDLRLPS